MSAACHLERVALYTPGRVEVTPDPPVAVAVAVAPAVECCEYCDAPTLAWRKCKQICQSCGQINRSCADL